MHAEILCAALATTARVWGLGLSPTPCLKAEARSERQEDRGVVVGESRRRAEGTSTRQTRKRYVDRRLFRQRIYRLRRLRTWRA